MPASSPGCTDSIVTSDHKPVFASFDVAILGQFVSEKGTAAQPGDKEIIFDDIKVEVSKCILVAGIFAAYPWFFQIYLQRLM